MDGRAPPVLRLGSDGSGPGSSTATPPELSPATDLSTSACSSSNRGDEGGRRVGATHESRRGGYLLLGTQPTVTGRAIIV